jgi:hypothetical protein
MSVKLECANVVLKDNEGNSGVVRTLSEADVVKVNGALADISDLQTRVKTVEDNGYVSYNGMQMLSETQREQAQANIDAPGLSVNNTFTGKITVESDVKADSFTLNTKSDYASLSASTNTYGITLKGGSSAGASLDLRGSTDTDAPNEFKLASGSVDLNGKSDGSLTWNSENVVRKVNNLPADANGNVLLGTEKSTFNKVVYDTGYFSVGTGATYAFDLTGTDLENVSKENVNIRLVAKVVTAGGGFKVGDIAQLTTALDMGAGNLDVCSYIQGNTLYFYSGGKQEFSISTQTAWLLKSQVQIKAVLTAFIPDDGSILLIAEDQTNSCSLVGLPDGTLTWGGVNLVRTVNGVAADTSGNVTINAPTLEEEWHDKNGNFCRVYSDSWCEQGGCMDIPNHGVPITTNFYKTFKDTNYKFFTQPQQTNGNPAADSSYCWIVKTKNTTNVVLVFYGRYVDIGNEYMMWHACGYIR